MITWMQKHRKYLVVTIWVSTIAFVGAGFVGWGAYDFKKDKTNAIAKVGKEKILIKDFQQSYGYFFNYYNSISNNELTQKQAEEMGLESIVISNLINDYLFINYAKDLGLSILEDDIKKVLLEDENFKKNGVFNKEQYFQVLRSVGTTAKEYENSLKNQVLLNKLNNILKLPTNKTEEEMLSASIFMKDKIKVNIIYVDDNEINISDEELKSEWETSKNLYLTKRIFKLSTIYIPAKEQEDIDENELKDFYNENKLDYKNAEDKIKSFEDALIDLKKDFSLRQTKKEALQTHLKLKKDEIVASEILKIQEDDQIFPVEKIIQGSIGETLKPIEYKDGFLIARIDEIIIPKPMAFEEAQTFVLDKLLKEKLEFLLQEKATKNLSNFNGIDIGFVSRDDARTIDGLSNEEFGYFVNNIFDNKNNQGYVLFNKKAAVYKIIDQKLFSSEKFEQYKSFIDQNILQLKNEMLKQKLLEELRKKYPIEQYYKGS